MKNKQYKCKLIFVNKREVYKKIRKEATTQEEAKKIMLSMAQLKMQPTFLTRVRILKERFSKAVHNFFKVG